MTAATGTTKRNGAASARGGAGAGHNALLGREALALAMVHADAEAVTDSAAPRPDVMLTIGVPDDVRSAREIRMRTSTVLERGLLPDGGAAAGDAEEFQETDAERGESRVQSGAPTDAFGDMMVDDDTPAGDSSVMTTLSSDGVMPSVQDTANEAAYTLMFVPPVSVTDHTAKCEGPVGSSGVEMLEASCATSDGHM